MSRATSVAESDAQHGDRPELESEAWRGPSLGNARRRPGLSNSSTTSDAKTQRSTRARSVGSVQPRVGSRDWTEPTFDQIAHLRKAQKSTVTPLDLIRPSIEARKIHEMKPPARPNDAVAASDVGLRPPPASRVRFMDAHRAYRPASAPFANLPCHSAVWTHWRFPLVNFPG